MTALASLLSPSDTAAGPRPPPPPRASMIHFDGIIDFLLAHPGAKLTEVALHMRRGLPWVSMVIKSDAFIEHYKRRREVLNQVLLDGVQQELAKVAVEAAGVMTKRLKDNPLGTTMDQLTTIVDKTTQRLGFGSAPPQGASVQIGIGPGAPPTAVFVASREQIAAAREAHRAAASALPVPENDRPSRNLPPASDDRPSRNDAPTRHADVEDLEPVAPTAPQADPAEPFEDRRIVVGSDA